MTWLTCIEIFTYSIKKNDYSWIHFDEMKYFAPFLVDNGQDVATNSDDQSNHKNNSQLQSNFVFDAMKKSGDSESQSNKGIRMQSTTQYNLSADASNVDSTGLTEVQSTQSAKKIKKVYTFNLSEDEVSLVKEVKKYPILYNSKHPGYKTKKKRFSAFRKIGLVLYGQETMLNNPSKGTHICHV